MWLRKNKQNGMWEAVRKGEIIAQGFWLDVVIMQALYFIKTKRDISKSSVAAS